ncbi:putative metalloprotease of the mitochondrial inner membrane [Nadsonia fulvescens var. elongata DSM 6958]|uniref:Mitochondrial inner membrane protease ATP23 n=1 Tax=Nadsonia fulvescens var. elongata DSM 6958 TaxID=857566 RepID=A0A1E3PJ86_9ASCO|nr:putative metalloprotease of the mitochondrial inner membrane [Nadsonia fulvescens var. elongata DSM 6958]
MGDNNSNSSDVSGSSLPSGFEYWRKNLCFMTNMGMTETERDEFAVFKEWRDKTKSCIKCEEWRDWVLDYSPTVTFMQDQITKIGGNINKTNIMCDICDESKGGGFNPQLGILLCANRLGSKFQLEDTLAHEMVHAYDHCKFDVDWFDLRHHACSEIRASSLSGECRFTRELRRGAFDNFMKGHQECVKRRATMSVMANPKCKGQEQARSVVDQVFQSCFSDTRPFDEIFR